MKPVVHSYFVNTVGGGGGTFTTGGWPSTTLAMTCILSSFSGA